MNLHEITAKITEHTPKPLGIERYYAVLLPLLEVNGETHILYEVRSANLLTQPGEISFPGGQIEEGESSAEAVVRETAEELNIAQSSIELISELDYIVSPYNLIIYAYAGIIHADPAQIHFNEEEVGAIFTVPLSYFSHTLPEVYEIELMTRLTEDFPYERIPNGKDYRWRTGKYPVYFYQYGEYVIWGITARLTAKLIELLQSNGAKG